LKNSFAMKKLVFLALLAAGATLEAATLDLVLPAGYQWYSTAGYTATATGLSANGTSTLTASGSSFDQRYFVAAASLADAQADIDGTPLTLPTVEATFTSGLSDVIGDLFAYDGVSAVNLHPAGDYDGSHIDVSTVSGFSFSAYSPATTISEVLSMASDFWGLAIALGLLIFGYTVARRKMLRVV